MLNVKSEAGITDFVECGMGGVLKGLAKRIDREMNVVAFQEFEDLQVS